MKRALGINVIFSALSGLALVAFHNIFASLFEVKEVTVFWIIGVALLFFASTILYEIRKLNKIRITWIIIQDLLWVMGSIYLLLADPFDISRTGNYIIAAVAFIVLMMAINQAVALKAHQKTAQD
ncbi:MAG: hypothetical protein ACOYXT_27495 [Bacteroidota bacterium]